jgi:predicted Rossmann fold flavoprotein
MDNKFNILIIGGGAAGLIAALQAKREAPFLKVAVLERESRPGKKLLATGNGRCNIANRNAAKTCFFNAAGSNPAFTQTALKAYSVEDNLRFFRSLGLLTKEEADGKMYPLGDQAAAVLDTLRLHIKAASADLMTETEVIAITPKPDKTLEITAKQGEKTKLFTAQAVILAIGGIASPQLSTSGNFAELLRPLGHNTTPLYPALCQIKTDSPLPKAMQGVKFNGRAELWQKTDNEYAMLAAEQGEILFTAYGLSGPPIFQLSRLISLNFSGSQTPKPQEIHLDFLPDFSENEIAKELTERQALPLTLEDYLSGMLNKRIGQQLIKTATTRKLSEPASSLTSAEISRLATVIKALPLPASGTMGWKNAQVMAGGLELKGFESQTLESRRIAGLFAAGEVLDVCGSCGGYNLSWAWSSGRLAAHSAVNRLKNKKIGPIL